MYRSMWRLSVGVTILSSVLVLIGCNRSQPSAISSSHKPTSNRLAFGRVYPVKAITDPLVAKTVRGADTTGPPVVSAEIRGFLIDWVTKEKQGRTEGTVTLELAVMKDGSLYRLVDQSHPGAWDGRPAPARLTPESTAEAERRNAAVAAARRAISKSYPEFASVKPVVYNYLVRINRKDGSIVDVWVDPDVGHGRFFYNERLRKVEN